MYSLLMPILLLPYFNTSLAVGEQAELAPQELEEWFQDDERFHPYVKKSDDGVLVFLKTPPAKRTPYSRNILTIPPHALQSSWVEIEQCHEQLDPNPSVELVYQYKHMRGLRITRYKHIGRVWVEGQSIQLEDVQKGAMLCIKTEARILYKQADGQYILRNGPFQRRFLDSYFPMHVSLTVRYPAHLLHFSTVTPVKQAGFEVKLENKTVHIDSLFEGKLTIEIVFRTMI